MSSNDSFYQTLDPKASSQSARRASGDSNGNAHYVAASPSTSPNRRPVQQATSSPAAAIDYARITNIGRPMDYSKQPPISPYGRSQTDLSSSPYSVPIRRVSNSSEDTFPFDNSHLGDMNQPPNSSPNAIMRTTLVNNSSASQPQPQQSYGSPAKASEGTTFSAPMISPSRKPVSVSVPITAPGPGALPPSAAGRKGSSSSSHGVPPSIPPSIPPTIPSSSASPSVTTLPTNSSQTTSTPSDDWAEKGAATMVRNETDENGNTATKLLKKGVKDFEFGDTLGEGSYSTVVAASDKQTLREYAIKVLDKRHIIKEKKVKYVNIEKDTLNRLGSHPGIVRLYYTFQDERSLYFVLDYAANGELLTLIKRTVTLNEECVRYFGAQLLDAVEFMHSKGVIHRDLKPENILLDYKMRIKITDFGTAKLLQPTGRDDTGEETYPPDARANSFVGTAEYLAPELLTIKYSGKACDLWAFGCILYQMIAGRPPFKAGNEYQTFQKIIKLQYSYPPGFPSVLRDLCKKLLVLNPQHRYTISQVKAHPFFDGVNWDRKVLWGSLPPRIGPYRSSSSSSSASVVPGISPIMMQARKISAQKIKSQVSQTALNKNSSAATAAAAALSKTPSAIQNQVYQQQIDQSRTQLQSQAQLQAQLQVNQQQQSSTQASRTPTDVSSSTSTPSQTLVQPPQQKRDSADGLGIRPTTSSSQAKSNPQLLHQKSAPILTAANRLSAQHSGGPSKTSGKSSSASSPNASPKLSQQSAPASPVLKQLPATQVDADYANLLMSHDERIIKLDTLNVVSSPNDDDLHPKKIRFFSGAKRKRRIVVVTTGGRLLLAGLDDKRLRVEVNLGNPHIIIREYPFNKKTGIGALSVEYQKSMLTLEDPRGTKEWTDAIDLSRRYYKQATALSESNAKTAMHAAALASGLGNSNGNTPRPKSQPQPASFSSSSTTNAATTSTSPNIPQSSKMVTGINSSFLHKNDARKVIRRAR